MNCYKCGNTCTQNNFSLTSCTCGMKFYSCGCGTLGELMRHLGNHLQGCQPDFDRKRFEKMVARLERLSENVA